MSDIEKQKYILTVYNTLTQRNEQVEVSEKIYHTYRRTNWNIDDNDASFFEHEIQMSGLIGGDDGAYENFKEFTDTENVPELIVENQIQAEALIRIIAQLSESDRQLIQALYFDSLTEREYADRLGVYRNAVHKRKMRILSKIKKLLES